METTTTRPPQVSSFGPAPPSAAIQSTPPPPLPDFSLAHGTTTMKTTPSTSHFGPTPTSPATPPTPKANRALDILLWIFSPQTVFAILLLVALGFAVNEVWKRWKLKKNQSGGIGHEARDENLATGDDQDDVALQPIPPDAQRAATTARLRRGTGLFGKLGHLLELNHPPEVRTHIAEKAYDERAAARAKIMYLREEELFASGIRSKPPRSLKYWEETFGTGHEKEA